MKNVMMKALKPTPQQAFDGLTMLFETAKENHKISQIEQTKRANINAIKEFEIEKIRAQKEVLKDYFEKTFSERRTNFDALFERLDKGIESGNLQLIQLALSVIVDIAKDSPLKQIEKLRSDFHNPDVKEIEI